MHIDLNAAPCAPQARNRLDTPVVRLLAVGEVAGVVPGAAGAAVAQKVRVGEVCADLLGGGPEVVEGVLLVGEDVAGGDQDGVGVDALAAVGQPEGVVEGEGRVGVRPPVEVPVGLWMLELVI